MCWHTELPKHFFIPWPEYRKLELHIFADASPKAYSIVIAAYVKTKLGDQTDCKFVITKSRIAPLKESGETSQKLFICY